MEATAIQSVEKNITMVALANVQPSNYNPRKNFDEASLAEEYSSAGCVTAYWSTPNRRQPL